MNRPRSLLVLGRALVLVGLTSPLACDCEATQVTVVFHAPASIQADARNLRIEIRPLGEGGGYDAERGFAPGGPATWPARLPVSPLGGDAERRFVVIGTLQNGDSLTIGTTSAETGFVSGSDREVHLWFDEPCRTTALCAARESCAMGSCVGHCVEPSVPGSTDRSEYRACGTSVDGGRLDGNVDGGDAGTPPCGPLDPDDDPIDWQALVQVAVDDPDRTVHHVSDAATMQSVASLLAPGDVVLIEDGTYEDWPRTIFDRPGTEDLPIVVTSESKANGAEGAVIFDGGTTFALFDKASWYILGGFTFRNYANSVLELRGTSGEAVPGSTDNRFTDNVFDECGDKTNSNGSSAVQGWERSHRTRVDHSIFKRLWYYGTSVDHSEEAVVNGGNADWRIDHNQFIDAPSAEERGDNNYIAAVSSCCAEVPVEAGGVSVTFEYNLVDLRESDSRGVDLPRGARLVARYNRFEHSAIGILLVGQSENIIEGNVFVGENDNEQAIIVLGSTFRFVNNVFYQIGTALNMNRWGNRGDECDGGPFTGDFLIAHNSFVDCDVGLQLGREFDGVCPLVRGVVRNNLFTSSLGDLFRLVETDLAGCMPMVCDPDLPAISSGENDVTVENNLYHVTGSAELGTGPLRETSRALTGDPALVAGCDGVPYRLSAESTAARGEASDPDDFPSCCAWDVPVTTDLDGENRPGGTANDVGADQFSE